MIRVHVCLLVVILHEWPRLHMQIMYSMHDRIVARIHVIIMIVVHYMAEDIQSECCTVLMCSGNSLCITLQLCFHMCVICPIVMLLL